MQQETVSYLMDFGMKGLTASPLEWESAPSLPVSQQPCWTLDTKGFTFCDSTPALHLPSWQQRLCVDLLFLEQLITTADVGSPVPQSCSC